jgi:hypothetical protein
MTDAHITKGVSNTVAYKNIEVGDYFTIPGIKDTIYLKTIDGVFIAATNTGNQGHKSYLHNTTEVVRITSMNLEYFV